MIYKILQNNETEKWELIRIFTGKLSYEVVVKSFNYCDCEHTKKLLMEVE